MVICKQPENFVVRLLLGVLPVFSHLGFLHFNTQKGSFAIFVCFLLVVVCWWSCSGFSLQVLGVFFKSVQAVLSFCYL